MREMHIIDDSQAESERNLSGIWAESETSHPAWKVQRNSRWNHNTTIEHEYSTARCCIAWMQMKPKRTTMIAVKKNWALTGQSRPHCFFTVTCAARSAAREGNKQTNSAQRHQIVAQDKKRTMKQECIHAHACWYIPQHAIRHIHVHTSLHAHMSLI